jgi:hypothetical protein
MSIHIHNGLPHAPKLSIIFDSGTALSSGYLPYHLGIMYKNPDLVASFECFDDANPFKTIKLGGVICHPDNYSASLHGQFTTIIHYKIPYIDMDGNPIYIYFGLSNDIIVNTILGMPIIIDLGMVPNFCTQSVICKDTNTTFNISFPETSCGFSTSNTETSTFSTLPITDMYPITQPVEPILDEPTDAPYFQTTNDISNSFLQWCLA